MNHILVAKPHPACILTTHPARAYIDPSDTDVAKTWAQHTRIANGGDLSGQTPANYGDDYDLIERTAHLDMMGEFAK